MFEIRTERFKPLESEPGFVLEVRPASYAFKMELSAKYQDSIGPDASDSQKPENLSDMITMSLEIVKHCVTKVEGLKLYDKEIKTVDELIEFAPPEVMDPIMAKSWSLFNVEEKQKKTS
jgi:hypothetical protein